MQIKSQNQMLNRRNHELNNLSTKFETINSQSTLINANLITNKGQDPEKERLMRENLSLMNMNYSLNTKLNQLNDVTNKSKNDVKIIFIIFIIIII
jgi:hypothetical protein